MPSTLQYSTVWYSTVHCSTVHCCTLHTKPRPFGFKTADGTVGSSKGRKGTQSPPALLSPQAPHSVLYCTQNTVDRGHRYSAYNATRNLTGLPLTTTGPPIRPTGPYKAGPSNYGSRSGPDLHTLLGVTGCNAVARGPSLLAADRVTQRLTRRRP